PQRFPQFCGKSRCSKCTKRLVRHICQRLKFCGQFSCGYWLKIRSMEPIPNEVDEPKQRNSHQNTRHEEGPIVFWFSVHPKLGSVGLCRCGLQIRSLRTSRKVVRKQEFFEVFDGQQISQTTFVLDFGSKGASIAAPKSLLCAVASERRRAKWKLKSESVGCGSAWKRLTGRTRIACSN